MKPNDHFRTIPINTGYIWTNDYDFEPEDRVFLLQEGYHSTVKYLENFIKRQNSQTTDEEDDYDESSSTTEELGDKILKDDDLEDEIFNPVTAQYEHYEASGTLANALAHVGIKRRTSRDSSTSK